MVGELLYQLDVRRGEDGLMVGAQTNMATHNQRRMRRRRSSSAKASWPVARHPSGAKSPPRTDAMLPLGSTRLAPPNTKYGYVVVTEDTGTVSKIFDILLPALQMNLMATVASTVHTRSNREKEEEEEEEELEQENRAPCVLFRKYVEQVIEMCSDGSGRLLAGANSLRVAPSLFAAMLSLGRVRWLSDSLLLPMSRLLSLLDDFNASDQESVKAEKSFRFLETDAYGDPGPHFSFHESVRGVNDGMTIVKTSNSGTNWCAVSVGPMVAGGRREITLRIDSVTAPVDPRYPSSTSSLILGVCKKNWVQSGDAPETWKTESWGWSTLHNATLHNVRTAPRLVNHHLKPGDIVKMILDLDQNTLAYVINGHKRVDAFGPADDMTGSSEFLMPLREHQISGPAHFVVSLQFPGDSVTILPEVKPMPLPSMLATEKLMASVVGRLTSTLIASLPMDADETELVPWLRSRVFSGGLDPRHLVDATAAEGASLSSSKFLQSIGIDASDQGTSNSLRQLSAHNSDDDDDKNSDALSWFDDRGMLSEDDLAAVCKHMTSKMTKKVIGAMANISPQDRTK
jgi:hypothetical protein